MNKQSPFKKIAANQTNEQIPQHQPLNREGQVKMLSGGYGFSLSDWSQLRSLLIMGGVGAYNERTEKIFPHSSELLLGLISQNGLQVVSTALEFSEKGLSLRNIYPVYSLALAASFGTPETRKAALEVLPNVARTGSDLLYFVDSFCKVWGGWGRAIKRAVNQWYTSRPLEDVVYQVLKYRNRHNWTHSDVMRLSHLRSHIQKTHPNPAAWEIFLAWMRGDEDAVKQAESHPELKMLVGFERIKQAKNDKEAAKLISEYRLSHEMIPNQWFDSTYVWSALYENMPYTAFIRTLNRTTAVGMMHDFEMRQYVLARLNDSAALARARVHPLNILTALYTYQAGAIHAVLKPVGAYDTRAIKVYRSGSIDRNVRWKPHPDVVKALDSAFYNAMTSGERHAGRVLIAVDTSLSMWTHIPNKAMTLSDVAAAITLIAKNRYHRVDVAGVDTRVNKKLGIQANMTLNQVKKIIGRIWGTATALDVLFPNLIEKHSVYDAILCLTDNESWAGKMHVQVAWEKYRAEVAPNARLLYAGMTASDYSLADPKDVTTKVAAGFDPSIFSILDMMLDGIL